MPVIVKAIDKGVEAALHACREVQIKKQLEILDLGLRGLHADQLKFAHIPEVSVKISESILSLENSLRLLQVENSPDIFLEEFIDVEERRKDETPLEFNLKLRLNEVYKKRYLPLIPEFAEAKKKLLQEINLKKQQEIKHINSNSPEEINRRIFEIEQKFNSKEKRKTQELKVRYAEELAAAESTYSLEVSPILQQMNVEIINKHFTVTIKELKRVFDEGNVAGLCLDVNSLSFYAFLSQSLDKLGKLDIVSSLGIPFVKDIVSKQIPSNERQSDVLSTIVLSKISSEIGNAVGDAIGKIVGEPLENLKHALKYSESMSSLEVPNSAMVVPFMDYYVRHPKVGKKEEAHNEVPTNFFQAIESISKADGVFGTLRSIKGLYTAITNGSQEKCLDESENIFDSMKQGMRDELLRQRYTILDHTMNSLSAFPILPEDWSDCYGNLKDLNAEKEELEREFDELNHQYTLFKQAFDVAKKEYDEARKRFDAEKDKSGNADFLVIEARKNSELTITLQAATDTILEESSFQMKAELMAAKKERYSDRFGFYTLYYTYDSTIEKFFENEVELDEVLAEKMLLIEEEFASNRDTLLERAEKDVVESIDRKYASEIEETLEGLKTLKGLEEECAIKRKAMASISREFYVEAQKFKESRNDFEQNVNYTLGKIKNLSTPDDNQHLWQLKTLSSWSASELAPLDFVVSILDQVGDKIKASAVTYSDVFRFATEETARDRKMKGEANRGMEAGIAAKLKASTGEMLGGSLVELKAGEQIGYLRSFAENIEDTLATEARFERLRGRLALDSADSLAARHEILTHESECALTKKEKSKLAKLFDGISQFFKNLNPFRKNDRKPAPKMNEEQIPLLNRYSKNQFKERKDIKKITQEPDAALPEKKIQINKTK